MRFENPATESKRAKHRAEQVAMIKMNREDSIIGADVPFLCMGATAPPRPEKGLSVAEYFHRKHASGHAGSFFPLHAIVLDVTQRTNIRHIKSEQTEQ